LHRDDALAGFRGFSVDTNPSLTPPTPVRGNPVFRFLLFADGGDFDIDRDRSAYERLQPGHLPSVLCVLGRGVLVPGEVELEEGNLKIARFGLTPEHNAGFIWTWLPTASPAMAYGILYSLLLVFLSRVYLEEWNVGAYVLPLLNFEDAIGFPM
jgi:hypothetical protein